MTPDPLIVTWQGRQVRVRHDDPRLGGDDDDDVDRMYGGTFSGDAGRDRIILCVDSPPAVYDSVEEVTEQPCTTG